MKTNLLVALLVAAPVSAFAAEPGFGPGQSLDAGDALKAAGRADGTSLARFLDLLGDATYAGASGRITVNDVEYTIVETRVISQRKTQDGFPGVTLRMYRRAALASNPAHVETFSDELTLVARGESLILKRDGRPDVAVRLVPVCGDNSCGDGRISFGYDKILPRYGAPVVEDITIMLHDGRLSIARVEGAAGGPKIREAFTAVR